MSNQIGKRRSRIQLPAFLAALFAFNATAAEIFPTRPIRFIYPYQAGSPLEVAIRDVNAEAAKVLGQPIVFENRPGANVRLGIAAVRQAGADGHTITFAPDTLLVHQPLIDANFSLEQGRDYQPVVFMMRNFLVLTAHPSLPFRDARGLISYAKANPGKLNWAFTPGSITQFLPEMFKQTTGIATTMVPYKGAADQLVPQLSGQVDLGIAGFSTLKPHIDSGKLIAIATLGQHRSEQFPNVPTLVESGVPISQTTWFGVVAPAGTPSEVVAKLYLAYNTAFKVPSVVKRLQDLSFASAADMTTDDFAALIRSERATWEPVLRKAGIKMQ